MTPHTTILTFDPGAHYAREWQGVATANTPEAIAALAARLDERAQRLADEPDGPRLGITVRARYQTPEGDWDVCEFTYPMDRTPMPLDPESDEPQHWPLIGDFVIDVINDFTEYLKTRYEGALPVIDILTFESRAISHQLLDSEAYATVQALSFSQGPCSLRDIEEINNDDSTPYPQEVNNIGAIVGKIETSEDGVSHVVLAPGYQIGHLMEMIATPEGAPVKLNQALHLEENDGTFMKPTTAANTRKTKLAP